MTRLLLALSALFALVYWMVWAAAPAVPLAGSVVKTLPVALLAVAGWRERAPLPIRLGLALGAAGDFLLSRPGEAAFLAGMGAFAAGHLAYVAGFGLRRPAWGVVAALLALAVSTEFWLAPFTGALLWPVRGYVLVICLMAACAAARPEPRLRLGAALFVLSDLMLALALFRATGTVQAVPARLVWPAYWMGQCLILLAFLPGLPSGRRND